MCGVPIADEHRHVVNVESRRLLCACVPCSLLFTRTAPDAATTAPSRTATAAAQSSTTQQWERLQVPVGMAFFFHNSALGRVVAQYPSPAGATESLLDLDAWDTIVARTRSRPRWSRTSRR